ncbi:MAG: hypothetical protein A2W90_04740 [Bacteroidetes bacterium GWF2_42_66]|nr:MAG: hypothetical protein A2W92_10880 [Bacteroidetes bacterium GWA2_42_15]OFY00771.1 MAG: hypothetical protein A2W89_20960 [Bacteroidetes bacterium GWE2_42_39]OFY40796.1 MAG: hypothetical protein A2W90_04740 [Bacteroidetes bacterium GWF2_42_66]HBL75812.1 hypothetical protein [Prolixibacteraceae bacterium]HCR91578.1 hypothetical protein [Prolixibacteraceae bacterium]
MGAFKFISSTASFVFQVILVVAAVLVFSYFDPFQLLAPTKNTLKDTPIQVRSIKEIGQLITAEYYGEVIASLNEVLTLEALNEIDSFNYEIDALHRAFIEAIDSAATLKMKKDKIYSWFNTEYRDLTEDKLFGNYIYYINEKLKNRNYRPKEINNTLGPTAIGNLITDLGLERKERLRESFRSITTDEIQYSFKYKQTESLDKNTKKRRLVLLGRGWVKAGFDFGTFSEKNFIFDRGHQRIVFIGLQPQIISATINPWFIPEEGVEGFEFVIVERKVKHDPELTKRVKHRCLDKLKKQAMDKKILEQAQTNAEKRLKSFFTLLCGEEIKEVSFHNDYLDYSLTALLSDSVLRNEEVVSVKNVLAEYKKKSGKEFKSADCKPFLDSLQKATKQINKLPFTLNSKSGLLFEIVRDQRVDSADFRYFRQLDEADFCDTIWYNCYKQSSQTALADYMNLTRETFRNDLNRFVEKLKLPADSSYLVIK